MNFLNKLLFYLPVIVILLIAAGAVFLITRDVLAGTSSMRRCPRCGGRRSLRRKDEGEFSDSRGWRCIRCGNEQDEFGNPL